MKQSRQENMIYLAVWCVLFATPVLSLYVRLVSDPDVPFDWKEVFFIWQRFAVYLLLFLLHNYLLAPLIVYGRKRSAYYTIMIVLLVAFTVFQCSRRPGGWERRDNNPSHMEFSRNHNPPADFEGEKPPVPQGPPPKISRHGLPPHIIGEREMMAVMLLILMFGVNLGVKFWFRGRYDRLRLAELERQNLEQQLECLRYQINPHFFMNTLNNIHALVDIDPEKSKDTIRELSRMMRYVLYEGNKKGVPLSRELDFIRHYVKLMGLRYTDKVRISMDLPQDVLDRQIPPLVLITFIENAFKHGITYQHESFVEVKVSLENDRLLFLCRNSKIGNSNLYGIEKDVLNENRGGVGLANVRKRLDLLYNQDYSLRIDDGTDVYTVNLNIPL